MNRNEAIEVAAKALHPDYDSADFGDEWKNLYRTRVNAVIAALLAAGVIPAEGTVTIPKAEHDFLLEFAREHSTTSGPSAYESYEAAAGRLLGEHLFGSSGDLDAIPAAPTGEETP